LFVIDAGKCFGPPPPGYTVLQNGDSTAKDVLDTEHVKVLPSFLIALYFTTHLGESAFSDVLLTTGIPSTNIWAVWSVYDVVRKGLHNELEGLLFYWKEDILVCHRLPKQAYKIIHKCAKCRWCVKTYIINILSEVLWFFGLKRRILDQY
jgi:hypothetical protein